MKRDEAREIYYEASATLSETVRHLDLAGVAVIWLFRVGEKTGGIVYAPIFLWPLVLFVLALGFDLLQYAYKAAAWGILHRVMEVKKVPEFSAPAAINWPTLIFFWGKVVFTVIAYFMLFYAISGELF